MRQASVVSYTQTKIYGTRPLLQTHPHLLSYMKTIINTALQSTAIPVSIDIAVLQPTSSVLPDHPQQLPNGVAAVIATFLLRAVTA
jgi:hypothetical protein